MYQLFVKFVGGARLPLTDHDEYSAALKAAETFYNFRRSEPEQGGITYTFHNTTTLNVFAIVRHNPRMRYKPDGTYAFLEIIESPSLAEKIKEGDLQRVADLVMARLVDAGVVPL